MKLDKEKYEMKIKEPKVRGPFINRELSLIDFNKRVISCAMKKNIPLNERMKFLAISDSNMDEMISVRFSNAYHDKEIEPYDKILSSISSFKDLQNETFQLLKKELEKKKVKFCKIESLNKREKGKVLEEFHNNIFPLLTPICVTDNEIPDIKSGELCIAATILNSGIEEVMIIPIDENIDKLYQIGDKVLLTEDIILYYMNDYLFINKSITSKGIFRIIRDGSIIISHDTSKFIVDRMKETIQKRNHGNPLFLELSSESSSRLLGILLSVFKIPDNHFYNKSKIILYKRFSQPLLDSSYSYIPFKPFIYDSKNYYNIFDAIKHEDILLHHPYDSFSTVVKFIEHAAEDSNVLAIKQTLYRVSSIDSPIVEALCKAARNGKKVSVLIEIKARFDEENNIKLVEKLRNNGATVILGNEWLKTHCKMCVIIRKEDKNDKKKISIYSHVNTGNYNEVTAKGYTDISYFTNNKKVGNDLLHIFNILSGHSSPDEKLQKIFYAPVSLRKKLISCIDREISLAKRGKKAEIFMKINSLSDKIMADKIYEAADKGVEIYIICRGVCSIVPRKNLYIKSIVGRFLEHSRIYYFKNGKNSEYYISSADLLTRNLDKRVETLISLKDSSVVQQLKWIINVYKEDTSNSFIMNKDGKWKESNGSISSHDWFIRHSDDKKKIKK